METMKYVLTMLLALVAVSTACSPSPSSTTTPALGITSSHSVVRIEFPAWVEESPQMASLWRYPMS